MGEALNQIKNIKNITICYKYSFNVDFKECEKRFKKRNSRQPL
ncbi:MAG: hypothetical protein ACJAU2_000612 [Maribacter sp.]|jgi:hypothetical protein